MIRKSMIILVTVWSVSIVLSCGTQFYKIVSIDLLPLDGATEFTDKNGIGFVVASATVPISYNPPLIKQCLAQYDPDEKVKYPLDTATFQLTLNKNISYDGSLLSAGTDMLAIPSIRSHSYF